MKYPKVESRDARLLVRSLGLLLNQVAVYGSAHNITKTAIDRFYALLNENLRRYRVLEFTVKSNLICVNGFSGDLDATLCANLSRRFAQLDIHGLAFVNPLAAREFERCVKVLSLPLAVIAEASGVAALLRKEKIRSVSVVRVDYRRVWGEEKASSDSLSGMGRAAKQSGGGAGVFDITDELVAAAPEFSGLGAEDAEKRRLSEKKRRQEQSAELAGLLREIAESLECDNENPKAVLGHVTGALERVRSSLLEMSRGSQRAITSFAQAVDADKLTVAGLEANAMSRGYDLKLTRETLIERYAELNQEIIQPLTVSTGAIEMLRKNQAGPISEPQSELLKMAHESIERVNELVNYIHTVTGLPESLHPDSAIIRDSYRS